MGESSKGKLSKLPDSWVERIFATMSAAYGTLFSDRWRDIDLGVVRGLWAESLASFSDHPECFRLALTSMVEECQFPPTLPEFISLCRRHYRAPKPPAVAAIEHHLTPEDIERNKARIAKMVASLGRRMTA